MYVKRIQIQNYGPIQALDIDFPFDGDKPKPMVLVGPNGSGKSILLSHIVNGLLIAQSRAFPESPEVERGKVYKLRSPKYVTSGREYSFIQVHFVDSPVLQELTLSKRKRDFTYMPSGIVEAGVQSLYDKLSADESSYFEFQIDQQKAQELLLKNCVLYFPPNRFEDPGWLNRDNLIATADYMDLKHLQGHSDRQIVNYAPLRHNQDWLFDVAYDSSMFERQEAVLPVLLDGQKGSNTINIPASISFHGSARRLYDAAIEILRRTLRQGNQLSLSIGRRQNRFVSVVANETTRVPNIFQLSTGEVSLLNLFLSILRNHDLMGVEFTGMEDIRGTVLVDEIDLHLHAVHQYEVLPGLIGMFPKVQFVVTCHSPLFVLGLKKTFGDDGLSLYELPEGCPIMSEEFSEVGTAYEAFIDTRRHTDDVREAVRNAQKPLVYVEGETDKRYLEAAIMKLGLDCVGCRMEIYAVGRGGGKTNLNAAWKGLQNLDGIRQPVVLLYDCDTKINDAVWPQEDPWAFRRKIERIETHPLRKGIENLFDRETLDQARQEKKAFIDVEEEYRKTVRGEKIVVPETWIVHRDEKTNLCNWLCEHGAADDFEHFIPTLQMLQDVLFVNAEENPT